MRHFGIHGAVSISILVVVLLIDGPAVIGASPASFETTTGAINSAYAATYTAGQAGGNVSQLVAKLNVALGLLEKAQVENSTNPNEATLDLQNATRIALQVSNEGPTVAQEGSSARQMTMVGSIGTAGVIVILAALVYIYGGRLYRGIWFYVYRNHVVRTRSG